MGRPRKNGMTVSSEQVLADTEEPGTRARLCFAINRLLAERNLTQTEAAKVLGVHQTTVSMLKGYQVARFSMERLLRLMNALGQDVVIEIRPMAEENGAGRVRVVGAA